MTASGATGVVVSVPVAAAGVVADVGVCNGGRVVDGYGDGLGVRGRVGDARAGAAFPAAGLAWPVHRDLLRAHVDDMQYGEARPSHTPTGPDGNWLRHTTLTWVERNFGYAVARAYAGHTDTNSHAGTTATYVRANLPEVAAALVALTGESHPLAIDPVHYPR